jgi:hypothetical protein
VESFLPLCWGTSPLPFTPSGEVRLLKGPVGPRGSLAHPGAAQPDVATDGRDGRCAPSPVRS